MSNKEIIVSANVRVDIANDIVVGTGDGLLEPVGLQQTVCLTDKSQGVIDPAIGKDQLRF